MMTAVESALLNDHAPGTKGGSRPVRVRVTIEGTPLRERKKKPPHVNQLGKAVKRK